MRGLSPKAARLDAPPTSIFGAARLLDEAGYTSVVATNCDQDYVRYLAPGDQVTATTVIEAISEQKTDRARHRLLRHPRARATATSTASEVGAMCFRVLKFKPASAPQPRRRRRRAAPSRDAAAPAALTHDNRFCWEGVAQRELRIQRCNACGALRHPPRPDVPRLPRRLEWDRRSRGARDASTASSSLHHPQFPGFELPAPIALVELEEGTRIVSNLVGVAPERGADRHAGRRSSSTRVEPGCMLPLLPAGGDARRATMDFSLCERAGGRARPRAQASSPSAAATRRALQRSSAGRRGSTRRCGRRSRRRICWAGACPRTHGGMRLRHARGCALVLQESRPRIVAPVPLLAVARARRRFRSRASAATRSASAGCARSRREARSDGRAGRARARRSRAAARHRAPRRPRLAPRRREGARAGVGHAPSCCWSRRRRDGGRRALPRRPRGGRRRARSSARPRAASRSRPPLAGAPAPTRVLGDAAAAPRSLRWLHDARAGRPSRDRSSASPSARCDDHRRLRAQRVQFGVPIGVLPGACSTARADGYIDLEAMRWTALAAAWRVARGRGRRAREAPVAKFWAADGGLGASPPRAAPARRHRRRPRLSDPPLLPVVEAARARRSAAPRRSSPASAASWPHPAAGAA